jgi:hypothetical protein
MPRDLRHHRAGRKGLFDHPHLIVARPATATFNPAQNLYPHLPTLRLALKPHAASEACHSTRRPTAEGYYQHDMGTGFGREAPFKTRTLDDGTVVIVDEAGNPSAAYLRATMRDMDVKEAGRLGVIATNKKFSKKKRRENARKAARARWNR